MARQFRFKMCAAVGVYVHARVGLMETKGDIATHLLLELQVVMSNLVRVMRTEFWSSRRAASTLKCWSISYTLPGAMHF